jgi:hypothetical protein
MPKFTRYIGVDYSGAQTPTASLNGLRVYLAEGDVPPAEVLPPSSPRKYWTRRGIAEWLVEKLAEGIPRWSASTTAFRFRCAISRCTASSPTGLCSWTTFSATGRPTMK